VRAWRLVPDTRGDGALGGARLGRGWPSARAWGLGAGDVCPNSSTWRACTRGRLGGVPRGRAWGLRAGCRGWCPRSLWDMRYGFLVFRVRSAALARGVGGQWITVKAWDRGLAVVAGHLGSRGPGAGAARPGRALGRVIGGRRSPRRLPPADRPRGSPACTAPGHAGMSLPGGSVERCQVRLVELVWSGSGFGGLGGCPGRPGWP
jgi:hypothetical protein